MVKDLENQGSQQVCDSFSFYQLDLAPPTASIPSDLEAHQSTWLFLISTQN